MNRSSRLPMPPGESHHQRIAFRWLAMSVFAGTSIWTYAVVGPLQLTSLGELAKLAGVSLIMLGKFVVFSGLHADTPSPWVIASLVWWIDLCLALLLTSGVQSLEHSAVLGRWMRRMRRRAVRVLREYPGLERTAFLGVATFVLLPLAATGAITAAFIARLLGLTRIASVAAIALGSLASSVSFALLAEVLGERAQDIARSPLLGLLLLGMLVVLARAAYTRILGRLRRAPTGSVTLPDEARGSAQDEVDSRRPPRG